MNRFISLNGLVEYVNNQEPQVLYGEREKSEAVKAGAGANYYFAKNVSMGINYTASQRDSTMPDSDYIQHSVTVGMTYSH